MSAEARLQDTFLTVAQVAERYGVSTDSIWRWKRDGKFPAPVRIGPNCTRWRASDLEIHETSFRACFAMGADFLVAA